MVKLEFKVFRERLGQLERQELKVRLVLVSKVRQEFKARQGFKVKLVPGFREKLELLV